ncbi:hypothetical protein QR680_018197 [Steinernema hermaphroditum]|uniref:7TM GPCR serpentine receptor class x (Srx) domain-containing protein n=1 Tax=Steinernema hermaphroditum TaxID=289476 RepID=A0AA39HJI1_9BILA|nr:hypothetical protein QR680_018197 [Steinernema hermaphroditum]
MAETIPPHVRILIGSIYVVTSLLLLAVTAVVIVAIVTSKRMRNIAAYVIILNIEIAAALQLVVHIVGGVMALVNTKFVPWLDKRLGAVAQLGWCTVNVLTLALALNRLSFFTSVNLFKHLQSFKPTIVLIAFSWLCGLYFFVVLLSPDTALRFHMEDLQWNYEDSPLLPLLTISERTIIVPAFAISFFIYIAICLMIWKNSTSNSPEVRLLVMAIITFLDEALLFSIYQFGEYVLPNSPYSRVAANFYWIVECGIHAITLLSVNSILRSRIFQAVTQNQIFHTSGSRSTHHQRNAFNEYRV